MKNILLAIIAILAPIGAFADSYTTLWKQVKDAQKKDLPKTEMAVLQKIANKATAEKQYGHLLKAQLMRSAAEASISPDSIDKDIAAIEHSYQQAKDPALKAVYASSLGRLYKEKEDNDDSQSSKLKAQSSKWYKLSLANPAMLAQHKSVEFEPATVNGIDSKIFYDDLLHVIGIEAGDYKTLHDYYVKNGNRTAACICALRDLQQKNNGSLSKKQRTSYLLKLDSLLRTYKDLREAGEVAIEFYNVSASDENAKPETLVSYINYALANWGTWQRMNILRNRLNDLQQPSFTINIGDYMLLPNVPRKIAVNSIRNIQELTLNVYKVNINGDTHLDPSQSKDYAKLKPLVSTTPAFSITKKYIGQPAWKEITDTLSIDELPIGVYLVEATTSNANIKPQRELLRVSNLYLMNQALPNNSIRYAVVDATSGKPVSGAHIRLTTYNGNTKNVQTLTTDHNGEATYKFDRNYSRQAWAYTDTDKACGEFSGYSYYSYWDNGQKETKRMEFYTDRSIYRPGQTVHVSAIAWTANKDSLSSKANASLQVTLTLQDANAKTVSEKTVTTDNYGSASADFVLPSSGLTGMFRIRANAADRNAYTFFHVEQYKRPTFQVTFDKYTEKYNIGDTISVKGVATTYSGVPVQGAKVQYSVKRREGLWWWRRGNVQEMMTDSVTTADDGSFLLRVPMLFPEDADLNHAVYYNFDINAKVTDGAGETHEGTTSLPLSNRTATLTSNLPDKILKDSLRTITFSYKNLLGETIPGNISYRIDNGNWQTAEANKQLAVSKLASGKHHLEAVCGNDTLRQDVVLFSYSDKRPATVTNDWFYISADKFPSDGSPVYLQAGSSAEDTQVYWTVCSGDKVIDSGTRSLGNTVVTRKLQYKKEYGDGITISQAWVVNGKLYSHTVQISRPQPNDKLTLTWKTFRDKLTPGQKETWTLNITSPDGKPAKAQLLSTMYDKSLDAIYSHSWRFDNNFYFSMPYMRWTGGSNAAIGLYGFQNFQYFKEKDLDFTHFDSDMFGWSNMPLGEIRMGHGIRMYKNAQVLAAAPMAMRSVDEVASSKASIRGAANGLESAEALNDAVEQNEESNQESQASTPNSQTIRENLNETAFFYPSLLTDKDGNVKISFTLPESVTTWRFMALAHDSLMNNATITAEAVASKTIMVQPNMPRFLREGDKATISTRIFNTSSKDVNGKVRLEILDAETEKVVSTTETTFSVAGNGTTTETFDVNPSEFAKNGSLFIARIVAEGNGFSDGEQQYLPVLTNKEQVVNTIPFYQNEPGVKTIDLSKLFPANTKNKKITIEYVNNPTWVVLQALPTVANPYDKDAMSLAAAIYANVIGKTVLTSSPKIAQTIKLWQQETGNETSLNSNLEKDQDLKTMVLNETPWVADAEHETDQKKQLAGFLDESTIDYRVNDFTQKLAQLQNGDGSFSWLPGMRRNIYMTTSVLETLVRLNTLVGYQNKTADMISRAFKYLDAEMAKEVSNLKKDEKKGIKSLTPSETACHWLYASALAKRKQTADITYLVNLLDKAPTKLTIYGKAGSAVILAQYGKTQHAKEYLQSIREYTVYKDEMGRYFDTPKAQYSWFDYRIPTQTFAIEALQRLTPNDTTTIREMQRWLLSEKRTTGWNTTINCVNAVYAFISNPSMYVSAPKENGWIATLTNSEMPTLTLDGQRLDLPKATAGIGYVKISKDVNNAKELTVDKTSNGTSWGAIYGQFMQKATEVSNATSGLSVTRQIIEQGNHKPQTSNLKPQTIGDKVTVRITITADRDYDFVQLQDKRAACMEPVGQLSGYHWSNTGGYYCAPQDNVTNYYFDGLSKGKHVIETSYYVDRNGDYNTGICTVQCAYAPEFSGREAAKTINVK